VKTPAKLAILSALTLLAGQAAIAQNEDSPCASVPGRSGAFRGLSIVSGCPFATALEIDRTPTLADGTRIQTTARGFLYRDSFGRIR
jgi:hypothetical protein